MNTETKQPHPPAATAPPGDNTTTRSNVSVAAPPPPLPEELTEQEADVLKYLPSIQEANVGDTKSLRQSIPQDDDKVDVFNNSDVLGEEPVEREAGRQIQKAWQDLAKKAVAMSSFTNNPVSSNDLDEELFIALEDDDDAVLQTRLAETKAELEQLDQEEDDDDEYEYGEDEDDIDNLEGKVRESSSFDSGGKAGVVPSSGPVTAATEITSPTGVPKPLNSTQQQQQSKIKKKKGHRRAESVEQAMFGLLSTPSTQSILINKQRTKNGQDVLSGTQNNQDLINAMSSTTKQSLNSPLHSTETLIDNAQAQVQEIRAKEKAQKDRQKKKKDSSNRRDDYDSDEDRQNELHHIIQAKGDSVGVNNGQTTTCNKAEDGVAFQTIEEDEEFHNDDGDENSSVSRSTESDEETGNASNATTGNVNSNKRKKTRRNLLVTGKFTSGLHQDWALFQQFLTPRKATMMFYFKIMTFAIVLPSLLIASLLFYLKEHPNRVELEMKIEEVQINATGTTFAIDTDYKASVSWWFLFLGVRQMITLTMALITQAIVIDYLALGSRFSLKYLGAATTLLAVQAKGWPSVLFFWAVYDLALLSGDTPLAHHWGFWQDWIELFNESNHSGSIVQSELNYRILIAAMVVGVAGAIKRVLLGLYLARQTLSNFGEEFDSVKRKMILVGELATLAMEIQIDTAGTSIFSGKTNHSVNSTNLNTIQATLTNVNREVEPVQKGNPGANAADAASSFVKQWQQSSAGDGGQQTTSDNSPLRSPSSEQTRKHTEASEDALTASEEIKLAELLDQWEGGEDRLSRKKQKSITIGAIMKFYKELTVMKRRYPFLPVFGRADTRDRCLASSQSLFNRLMLRTPDLKKLPFSSIAILAKDDNGRMDQKKLKELIKLFRPDRDQRLSKLDFVRSIDAIFKALRQLSLNIEDSGQINMALTFLVNIFFYFLVACFVLQQLGVDPIGLFLSLSTSILTFAVIFGRSGAKYFEGILFIVVQRPYGVGDRIHLSNPASDTNSNGSSGWIVEKVTLTTTTVYWGATNERATLSNGAISNLRVINAARSPKATIYVPMKFGINTQYKKIQVFRMAAEQYLKQRPREFAAFIGFRPSEVVFERGYIGYTLIAQHREGWQKIGSILGSKANLTTYLLEVAKQLGMRYVSPALPVELDFRDASSALRAVGLDKADIEKQGVALATTSNKKLD